MDQSNGRRTSDDGGGRRTGGDGMSGVSAGLEAGSGSRPGRGTARGEPRGGGSAPPDLPRRLAAEVVGTALLLAVVVGSGIMGERLAGGDAALAMVANAVATGAGLAVLGLAFGPVSGAHFNPAVTLVFRLRRELGGRDALSYVLAQFAGALAGVMLAHAMFGEPLLAASVQARGGGGPWLGEFVAAFGLLTVILGCRRARPEAAPFAVGLFITAGHWFTSSSSFANPAVTAARMLTDTFTGIAPADAPAFIAAQLAGAAAAAGFFRWLHSTARDGRAP